MAHNHKSMNLEDLTTVSDSFKLQINPRSGLSYDYLNELHSKILIIKTNNMDYFDDLQQPLPLYVQYCISKEDSRDELLDMAKPLAIIKHDDLVTQFNAESFEEKKSVTVLENYLQSFKKIINGSYI